MYEIILFDLDDTLLDFSASENKSLETIHQMFYSSLSYNEFEKRFKTINNALWQRVGARENSLLPGDIRLLRFEQLHKDLDCEAHLVPSIAEIYDEGLGEHADWLPGVKTAIEFLHQKEHTLGIVTNGLLYAQDKKHNRHQLDKWFDCFIVSERVGVAKPHKAIFELAFYEIAKKQGLHPSSLTTKSMLMVGDSLASDGHGAANLGIDFCFINQQAILTEQSDLSIKHDIRSVSQLPACLGYAEEYLSFID